MSADLILAADGMNSLIRRRMAVANGEVDKLAPSRELAHRFVLSEEMVRHDEAVRALLARNRGMRYLGTGGHIMAYPLRNNTLYNVVLIRTTDGERRRQTSWTTQGKKDEILDHYRGWCPMVRALVSYAPSSGILETPMNNMPPLPTWVKGRVALAGDACHYMLPYVAQGASNALEDAATLAMAFTCTEHIERALEVYQQVRKSRSEWIQASAKSTGHVLHLPDGEGQMRRDEAIRAASQGVGANPDQWGDKQSHEIMWRADVMAETIDKFQVLTAGAEGR